jgi:hypothetical protein
MKSVSVIVCRGEAENTRVAAVICSASVLITVSIAGTPVARNMTTTQRNIAFLIMLFTLLANITVVIIKHPVLGNLSLLLALLAVCTDHYQYKDDKKTKGYAKVKY